MGRGRAKAKQTKVARKLKYNTSGTDLDRLRAELGAAPAPSSHGSDAYEDSYDDSYDDLADRYAHYIDDYGDEDDGQAHSSSHRQDR